MDDLRLAVSSKLETSYSSAPSKEFLLPLAAQINRVPLPLVPDSFGIRLPHERERLTAVNWEIKPVKEKRSYPKDNDEEMQNGTSRPKLEMQTPGMGTRSSPLAGASHGQDTEMDLSGRDDLFGGDDNEDEDDSRVLPNAVRAEGGDDDDEEDEDDEFEMEDALAPSNGRDGSGAQEDGSATPGEGDGEGEEDDEEDNEDAEQEEDDEEDGEGAGQEGEDEDGEASGDGEMTGEVGERNGVEDDDYDA